MSNRVITISAGANYVLASPGPAASLKVPLTIAVFPGASGSVAVEAMVAFGGTWRALSAGNLSGTLTASASDVLVGNLYALRFTATTSAATVEISQ